MVARLKYNSPVILTFALICSIIFILDKFTANHLMRLFAVGSEIDFTNPLSVFTLFSHIFGHANMEHLLGNLTLVLLLGPIAEEKYGSLNIFIMILITAFITGLLNVIFFDTALMGASGIVFMLILLVSFTNVDAGQIPMTFVLVAILFIGKELLLSVKDDQVAQYAHIIGGFCGGVFGFTGILKRNY